MKFRSQPREPQKPTDGRCQPPTTKDHTSILPLLSHGPRLKKNYRKYGPKFCPSIGLASTTTSLIWGVIRWQPLGSLPRASGNSSLRYLSKLYFEHRQ